MTAPEPIGPELLSLLRDARAASHRSEATLPDRVGAVAETADGGRHPGVGCLPAAGVCAERVAIWAARAATPAPIARLAIWLPAGAGAHPCGACLQVLRELAPGAELVVQRGDGPPGRRRIEELLPDAFVSYTPTPPTPATEEEQPS